MHKVALQKPPLALKFANFFGTLGYMSLLFEWLWVFGLLLYPYAKKFNFILPSNEPASPPAPLFPVDSTLALIVGIIITALCFAVAAYALYSVPRSIAKTGSRATHIAASKFIPTITHHKHISKKETKRLTFTTICSIKLVATVLPLATCLVLPESAMLAKQIVSIVAVFFAFWVVVNFGVQLIITKITKLDTYQVW